ncbi:MFS transporter [Actinospica durhamensis]|uniref:MFS transporter n=1 Tax=Actinospica durhamensis TaxID=1508375 RepID=A0A941EM27_9ACTN|nr:MFS transporter [Actinospica durhamensis]MBR7834905.1 MFS transporter [Actinospica durhamensis]
MLPSESRLSRRSDLRLALLAFAQLIATIDINIVFIALPDIGRQLGFNADSLQWVVSAYVLGLGGFLLLGGRAVDRFGPRRMFSLALALYAISSLAGGLSHDQRLLVAARFVQGLGGALVTPATLKLIYLNFPDPRERTRAVSVWGAAGGAGLSVGAILSGVLTNYLGWSWVFFVNVPLALLAAAAAPKLLEPDPPAATEGSFDVLGAVITTVGISSIVFGLVSGPISGWGSARAAGSMILGAVLLALFVALEARSRDPLVPLRMFRNQHLRTVMIVIFLFQGGLSFTYYMFTTYLQDGLSYSALGAGLAFLPPTLVSMVSALKVNPWLVGRYGVRAVLVGGTLLIAVGLAGVTASLSVGGSSWSMLPGAVVWGFAGGAAFPTIFVAAAQGVAPKEQGVAAGLVSTFRQVGGAVGLAVLVAIATAGLATGAHATPSLSGVVSGIRTAGWVATGLTAFAALLALRLGKPVPAPAPARPRRPPRPSRAPHRARRHDDRGAHRRPDPRRAGRLVANQGTDAHGRPRRWTRRGRRRVGGWLPEVVRVRVGVVEHEVRVRVGLVIGQDGGPPSRGRLQVAAVGAQIAARGDRGGVDVLRVAPGIGVPVPGLGKQLQGPDRVIVYGVTGERAVIHRRQVPPAGRAVERRPDDRLGLGAVRGKGGTAEPALVGFDHAYPGQGVPGQMAAGRLALQHEFGVSVTLGRARRDPGRGRDPGRPGSEQLRSRLRGHRARPHGPCARCREPRSDVRARWPRHRARRSLRLLRNRRGRRIGPGRRRPGAGGGTREQPHETTDDAGQPDADQRRARQRGYAPVRHRYWEPSVGTEATFSFTFTSQVIAFISGAAPTRASVPVRPTRQPRAAQPDTPRPLGSSHTLPVEFDHRVARIGPTPTPPRLPAKARRRADGGPSRHTHMRHTRTLM